jgi:hypothetical protein
MEKKFGNKLLMLGSPLLIASFIAIIAYEKKLQSGYKDLLEDRINNIIAKIQNFTAAECVQALNAYANVLQKLLLWEEPADSLLALNYRLARNCSSLQKIKLSLDQRMAMLAAQKD